MGKRGDDKDHDAELWARVAETARPLHKGRAVAKPPHVKPKPVADAPSHKEAAGEKAVRKTQQIPVRPKPAPIPRGTSLDRITARKLETGRVAVEARLDLHGMRQREAHAALRRFLKSAQAQGYRNVLVITGKGTREEAKSFYEEDERGVLRQAVPQWLSGAEFADLVISYAQAPRRLGGEGALYVRVRRGRT
ncbi:MAG: Smr/MutS family protein [Methyloceanibacter sp.]|uniref:Smr/MutS family protein n=1 Tax=Methyloceanibacter sp. TaxID=1965321 RepID=UPI003D9BCD3F